MSADETKGRRFAEVRGETLLTVVRSLLATGAEEEALKRFGEVAVLIPLEDAEVIKSFVRERTTSAAASAGTPTASNLDFPTCKHRTL